MRLPIKSIWRVPAYLPYLQPPLTDSAVAEAEKQIGYKVPVEYLNLLRQQNGGYIRYSIPEMVHDTIAGIGPHYPSLTRFDWEEVQEYVTFPLQGLVPFDGDGHWHLCIDYRKKPKAPSVTYVDVECNSEESLADSFAEYLALLKIDTRGELVIEGGDVETVIDLLKSQLKAVFEEPRRGSGERPPSYYGRFKDEVIMLTPNWTERGDVHPSDERYEEVRDLLPGYASPHPEVSASSYFLYADELIRSNVIGACNKSRQLVRPLTEFLDSSF